MRMRRQVGALILYGGWLLLFNPDAHTPDAPLGRWKKKSEHDSAYLCERARNKAVDDLLRDQQQSPDGQGLGPVSAAVRFRCERAERFEALRR